MSSKIAGAFWNLLSSPLSKDFDNKAEDTEKLVKEERKSDLVLTNISSENDTETSDTETPDTSLRDVMQESYLIDENNRIFLLTREAIYSLMEAICRESKLLHLDLDLIVGKVYPKLKTKNVYSDIEDTIVMTTTELSTTHIDYAKIASYLLVTKLHKDTQDDYLGVVETLRNNTDENGNPVPIVNDDFYEFVKSNRDKINKIINYERDFRFTVFGFRTLEKTYLKRTSDNRIVERPQHMYMRVAIALHCGSGVYKIGNMKAVKRTYDLISQGYYTHATPTLFNAGTYYQQLASCFLLGVGDSMESIGECWKNCGLISKFSGGIGINCTNIRVEGAYIRSTHGRANGMRVLRVFNDIATYANQGGKRSGSIAIFIEPWHGDIFFFLDLKKNIGADTERARDLFLALTVNDIFMQRVEADGIWSLMCPSSCPNLLNKYGTEFTRIYEEYEKQGNYVSQIPARELWFKIMETQIESGVPYIIYKDAINNKSNQINIGVINGSNLCTEIMEYSSDDEYAVCNLASVGLPMFVIRENDQVKFDFQRLYEVVMIIARNLDLLIDENFYPVVRAQKSNLRHRPMGIGIQGLADVFAMFRYPFDSEPARKLNREIFETIYFAAMTKSCALAKKFGPYETYEGSPISQGKFQFDLWGLDKSKLSGMWDWEGLREKISLYGVRHSLMISPMPTASTSQILGNNECFEPFTTNIYSRSTTAGSFYVVNKYLMKELQDLGLWDDNMLDLIKYHGGSVQNIDTIPDDVKKIYRTVWEIPQKSLIEMSADRAPFVDQSQSLNIFIDKPNFAKLTSCLFHGWRLGLKTGMYYLRSKSASDAGQFGIDISKIKDIEESRSNTNTFYLNELAKQIEMDMNRNTNVNEECLSCQC